MIAAILASATLCVAVPTATRPIYFERGHVPETPGWMTACNITPPGWRPMRYAPRDGTVIEVRNAFGMLPTFGIYRWVGEKGGLPWADATPRPPCKDPPPLAMKNKRGEVIGWVSGSTCIFVGFDLESEPGIAWRPLTVKPADYKPHNPTNADWARAARAGR